MFSLMVKNGGLSVVSKNDLCWVCTLLTIIDFFDHYWLCDIWTRIQNHPHFLCNGKTSLKPPYLQTQEKTSWFKHSYICWYKITKNIIPKWWFTGEKNITFNKPMSVVSCLPPVSQQTWLLGTHAECLACGGGHGFPFSQFSPTFVPWDIEWIMVADWETATSLEVDFGLLSVQRTPVFDTLKTGQDGL